MPRGGHTINPTIEAVLTHAETDLWTAWERATNFQQSVIRGDEREEAVRKFLRSRLPKDFEVVKGEVIDYRNTRSTQLDVIIYDSARNCPILAENGHTLLPSEAILAIIEVKSILNQKELKNCFAAAAQIRKLRPFKETFVGPRQDGAPASDNNYRCFYSIFAYESNLGEADWLSKEWGRVQLAASEERCDVSVMDRILVLNRGMINTTSKSGKVCGDNSAAMLHEWFLNLTNFLTRENERRPAVDWQVYSTRSSKGWMQL